MDVVLVLPMPSPLYIPAADPALTTLMALQAHSGCARARSRPHCLRSFRRCETLPFALCALRCALPCHGELSQRWKMGLCSNAKSVAQMRACALHGNSRLPVLSLHTDESIATAHQGSLDTSHLTVDCVGYLSARCWRRWCGLQPADPQGLKNVIGPAIHFIRLNVRALRLAFGVDAAKAERSLSL